MRTVADIKPKRPSRGAGFFIKGICMKPNRGQYKKLDRLAKIILKAVSV